MAAIRYRTGIDRVTGQPLTGWPHVCQSLGIIWTTVMGQIVMRLDLGTRLRSWLAEDINTETALGIYDELITSAETWEPEYRVKELQLLRITRDGGLGLRHGGLYYPEGRYGNYSIALPVGSRLKLTADRLQTRGPH
jgi:phage baseplate assembly protein W